MSILKMITGKKFGLSARLRHRLDAVRPHSLAQSVSQSADSEDPDEDSPRLGLVHHGRLGAFVDPTSAASDAFVSRRADARERGGGD